MLSSLNYFRGCMVFVLLTISISSSAACMSDCQQESEDQLWLSTLGNNVNLEQAFSDSPIDDGETLDQGAQADTQCSSYLQNKLKTLQLNIQSVNSHSLCEIVAAEAEWDIKLQKIKAILPSLPPGTYSLMRQQNL